jgi:hypothetical protein
MGSVCILCSVVGRGGSIPSAAVVSSDYRRTVCGVVVDAVPPRKGLDAYGGTRGDPRPRRIPPGLLATAPTRLTAKHEGYLVFRGFC